MTKIDFYSGRQPHIIEVEVGGERREYKLPTDFTVEEVERFYEVEKRVKENPDEDNGFLVLITEVLVLLKRYQPEITVEDVKKIPIPSLKKIMKFVNENNFSTMFGISAEDIDISKKKVLKKS